MSDRPPAVCLVSGGMDSAVTLAEARVQGFECHALILDYGQRHQIEIEAAKRVAKAQGVESVRIVKVDLSAIGGSALTEDIDVPKSRSEETIGSGVPVTYVPARNTVFLAIALGWAEVLGATHLFLGINHVDYSGYPDCRPEFLRAFEALADKATALAVEEGEHFKILAPLLEMSKAQIVKRAVDLNVDLGLTHSCYDPVERAGQVLACGTCDACQLRLRGFEEAGVADPIPYV